MKAKIGLLILFLTLLLILLGVRSNFKTFPLASEIFIEHPNSIKLDYYDNPEWWDYKNLSKIRERIKDYLERNPDISINIKSVLNALEFEKGMNKEQVLLVTGEPRKRKVLKDGTELWTYSGAKGGILQWYYEWGRLKFKDGILMDIEAQFLTVYK